jgi:cytochrome P450
MFTNLPLPANRRRDRAQKEMSEFYMGIIRSRREGESDVSDPDQDRKNESAIIRDDLSPSAPALTQLNDEPC